MANPPPTIEDQLRQEMAVLRDRFDDLEAMVLAVKKPNPKPTRNWAGVLVFLTLALWASPKNISIGGNTYQSEGLPAETITAIAGIYYTGKWAVQRLQEDTEE